MGNLRQQPRNLEIGMSEFLLDTGESAFEKRDYLNAHGKRKKKKAKKKKKKVRIRKRKRIRLKNGTVKEVTVEVEQVKNADGSPVTKQEAAQNQAQENEAIQNQANQLEEEAAQQQAQESQAQEPQPQEAAPEQEAQPEQPTEENSVEGEPMADNGYLLDCGESAFEKRQYLNAAGKKKKKKVKKVRKKKKVKTKSGETAEIEVEVPVQVNEDGSPLTKAEQAQNDSAEKKAITAELKNKNIEPSSVVDVKNATSADKDEPASDKTESGSDKPKAELVFGMPKMVAYGGAAVVGVLFITGLVLVLRKGKKNESA